MEAPSKRWRLHFSTVLKETFNISKDVAGTYNVNINGISGKFMIKVPPVAPAISWGLIGGIIAAAVVIIGLLVYFFVWRKRGEPRPS